MDVLFLFEKCEEKKDVGYLKNSKKFKKHLKKK